MSDRSRLSASDRLRIGQVFEEHRPFVEAVAVQHAGRDDAPDVVAEVGLRLCTSLNGLREAGAVRAWIYRVTVAAARDVHRARVRLDRTREAVAAATTAHEAIEDPDEVVQRNRRQQAFLDALDRLKSREKTAICHTLGLGSVSVLDAADRQALSRARRRLRDVLQSDPRLAE